MQKNRGLLSIPAWSASAPTDRWMRADAAEVYPLSLRSCAVTILNGSRTIPRFESGARAVDTNLYPAPVCVGFSKDGRYMLATLFNGGLAVIDLRGVESGTQPKKQLRHYGHEDADFIIQDI
jgi:hypothetical protein